MFTNTYFIRHILGNETSKFVVLRLAWLLCTWTVLGTLPSLPFLLFISLFLLYIIYFIIFYSLLFFIILLGIIFLLEHGMAYKRVEPVVSISWASCFILKWNNPKPETDHRLESVICIAVCTCRYIHRESEMSEWAVFNIPVNTYWVILGTSLSSQSLAILLSA